MDQPASVFLDMHTSNSRSDFGTFGFEGQRSLKAQWQIILGDLVALRQIGVAVVLAVHFGEGGDLAVQRETGFDAHLDGSFVDNGKCAGKPKADRASVGIGGSA